MATDPHHPEVIKTVYTESEAAAIVTLLAARGIEATATGGFTAGFRTETAGEIRIMIHHENMAAATELLKEIESGDSEVDWSQVDVGEPEDS